MNAITDFSPHRPCDDMTAWNDRLQMLEVIGIFEEAPQVRTFVFRSDEGTWFRYRPGQFVTLELPAAEGPLLRTYTLSSSPSRPFSIAVTVKAQADSVGTRWMFDNLVIGARLRAYGPAGDFSHHSHPAGRYFFVSAGSGITPTMSMLRWLSDCAPATDVAFVTCARRPRDIIFRRELELLASRMPGLSLSFLVEEAPDGEVWSGHRGRIDAARLPLVAPDFLEREIFCCGPEPFMHGLRAILGDAGFDMAHYHEESFVRPAMPAPLAEMPAADAARQEAVAIRFAVSGVEAVAPAGQSVLQAARAAGVRIAAACESGLCGTCKVMKTAGEVEMSHNGGILDDEIAEGYILACCSRPLGPVEIEA